ncbi:MAG: PKD domain-containing protein [Candidatus Thiodiazotropha sp.]
MVRIDQAPLCIFIFQYVVRLPRFKRIQLVVFSGILAVFYGCGGGGGGNDDNDESFVNIPPTASLSASHTSGNAPLKVSFDASESSDTDGTIVNYHWNFGDGTSKIDMICSKTYNSAGTYSVTLTVTDDRSAKDSTTQLITVTEEEKNNPPTASFTASPTNGIAPLTVSFDASASSDSDGHIVSYDWHFGDNTTGTGQNTTKTYPIAGTYTITLTLTDDDNTTASTSKQIVVEDLETNVNTSNVESIFAAVLQSKRFLNIATAIPYQVALNYIDTWPIGHTNTFHFQDLSISSLELDGYVDMTLLNTSYNFDATPPYFIIFDFYLIDFSISENEYTVYGNGDINMHLSNAGYGVQVASLSGEHIVLDSSSELDSLTDYLYVLSFYTNDDFEYELSGDLESTKFSDVFSFTSADTPFTGNSNVSFGNPTAGLLHITALRDASQAYIIPQPDGVNVQIDIDLNGDSMADTTVMSTWSEIFEIMAN